MQAKGSGASTSNPNANQWLWSKVWKAKVPMKVKHLMYRALKEGLPMLTKLSQRGMNIDNMFPRCREGPETITHMLMLCKDNKIIWKISPVRLEVNNWERSFGSGVKALQRSVAWSMLEKW